MGTTVTDSDKWILTYFQLYGRGEACRMALEHGKVNWEDNAVTGEAWTAFKASGKCANGQLPVLEVNGKYLNQSEAIIRFIGRKTGAYPTEDPFACHFADSVINTCSDFEQRAPKPTTASPSCTRCSAPSRSPTKMSRRWWRVGRDSKSKGMPLQQKIKGPDTSLQLDEVTG